MNKYPCEEPYYEPVADDPRAPMRVAKCIHSHYGLCANVKCSFMGQVCPNIGTAWGWDYRILQEDNGEVEA